MKFRAVCRPTPIGSRVLTRWCRSRYVIMRPAVLIGVLTVCAVGCQSVSEPGLRASRLDNLAVDDDPSEGDDDTKIRRARGQSADEDSSAPLDARPATPLGLPPLRTLLDDDPRDDDTEDPRAATETTKPDIAAPGPDTADFCNSPYTLPQGRFYIETSPLFLSGASEGSAKTYNAEFLLRYGLTDRVELRLFSNGPTYETGHFAASGMAPIAYDLKTNLWKENEEYHIPAVGIEVFILTTSGSKRLNQGTQPSINLLFEHTLPWDWVLEWNVGMVGDPSPNNKFSSIEPAASWSFTHRLIGPVEVFFQGYFNGPTLPVYADGVELGIGAIWTVNQRLAIYGSYNLGISPGAPTDIAQAGFAYAF